MHKFPSSGKVPKVFPHSFVHVHFGWLLHLVTEHSVLGITVLHLCGKNKSLPAAVSGGETMPSLCMALLVFKVKAEESFDVIFF